MGGAILPDSVAMHGARDAGCGQWVSVFSVCEAKSTKIEEDFSPATGVISIDRGNVKEPQTDEQFPDLCEWRTAVVTAIAP
jgi:hypothetical protein